MKHVITIIMTLAITASTPAFVLVGPVDLAEQTLSFGGTPVTKRQHRRIGCSDSLMSFTGGTPLI